MTTNSKLRMQKATANTICYSSPHRACVETSLELLRLLNLDPAERLLVSGRLQARRWGSLEGLSASRLHGKHSLEDNGVESEKALRNRLQDWLREVESTYKGLKVIVVACPHIVQELCHLCRTSKVVAEHNVTCEG
uniref:Uncharacterized protein n=1 Tax=Guillardia theta TaxID=55529 RepID=A0A7S4NT31_GUITH|mmetsp:Transcript_32561/g.103131  ORF Transcript_32561/g.103131 Transcript_32561/m.103131 type:complete len:136 (+) Transcript_32561:949-1356(+)